MITLRVKGIEKIRRMGQKYPVASAKHFGKAIQRGLLKVQRSATMNAPVDTGGLRGAWDLRVGLLKGSLTNKKEYSRAVEYGTRPHFPPINELEGWARRKGVNPYVVARSIGRKGTKPTGFFEKAVRSNKDSFEKEFEKAIDKILDEV